MDLTSIIGIVAGIAIVLQGISQSGSLMNFFDLPSIVIVFGGVICSVIASFPFSTLKNVVGHMKVLVKGKTYKPEPLIESLVEFAQIARKNGLLALEEKANELEDPFYKRSIMLVVDAMEAEKVREMLEAEVDNMAARHEEEASVYEKASA